MNLEIKHIAPYLPYGLKMLFTYGNKVGELTNLYDIKQYDDIKLSIDYSQGEHIWMYKPILRPLSDLNTLGEQEFATEYSIDLMLKKLHPKMGVSFFEHNKKLHFEFDLSFDHSSTLLCDFEIYEQVKNELLRSHYDILGLIDLGLAVNINTLKEVE